MCRRMSVDLRSSFRLSFVASDTELPVPPVSEVLGRVRSSPSWDVASISPAHVQFPRAHVEWHGGQGFLIQCFEDDQSWGYFLTSSLHFSPPTIEINLGGQALERWPSELFVPEQLASQAFDCFLDSGRQDPALHWVRIDAFPRETIWEGREGREAWERVNPATSRDV